MNINIGSLQDEIDSSREILLRDVAEEVGEAILLPAEDSIPGVYQVWFSVLDRLG